MDASLWVASLALFWILLLAFAWLKDKRNHNSVHEVQHEVLDRIRERLELLESQAHDIPPVRIAHLEGMVADERMRRRDLQEEVNGTVRGMDRQRQRIEKVEAVLDVGKRTDGSEAKLVGLALADRIDALSARMDAVELETGLREKPKTMGGS